MKGSMIGKETPRKPPIVLVVDDESAIVAAFSETLQLDGYEAVPAHSAEDGLRLLDDGLMPDAVLLDLRMPGMGGLRIPALPARTSGPTEDSGRGGYGGHAPGRHGAGGGAGAWRRSLLQADDHAGRSARSRPD